MDKGQNKENSEDIVVQHPEQNYKEKQIESQTPSLSFSSEYTLATTPVSIRLKKEKLGSQDQRQPTGLKKFGALFVKHQREWIKTSCCGCCELLFPLALLALMILVRFSIKPFTSGFQMDSFKHSSYPVGKVNNITQQWEQYSFYEKQKFQDDVQPFFLYSNLTNTRKVGPNKQLQDVYIPDYDFLGPYFYYPMACYSKTSYDKSFPIIGYVKNDNVVERALLDQYKMVFKSQSEAQDMISMVANFIQQIKGTLGKGSEGTVGAKKLSLNDIIGGQGPQFPQDLVDAAGGLEQTDAAMGGVEMFGNFTFKEFTSKQEMEDYLSADDYATPSKPGMCFGFQILENDKKNKYELEVFMNNKWPNFRRYAPDQTFISWRPYSNDPIILGYTKLVYNGFTLIENWVANIILQLKTGNQNAKIVSIISPQKTPTVSVDGFQVFMDSTFHYCVLLMYLPLVYRYLLRIVEERQSRRKQLIYAFGVRVGPYWFSWWACYTLTNMVIAFLYAALLNRFILKHSKIPILFIVFLLIGQALFGLVWISSTLFDSPPMACILFTVVIWAMIVIEFFLDQKWMWVPPQGLKFFVCLFNPLFTIKQTIRTIVVYDSAKLEVNLANGWRIRQNFSTNLGIVLLIINCAINNAIAFILELRVSNIHDKDSKNSLCRFGKLEDNGSNKIAVQMEASIDSEITLSNCLIRQEKSNITALLGQSGSGKSRTLRKQFEFLGDNKIVGYLPKHIVLFDLFNAAEHLQFFTKINGIESSYTQEKRITKLLDKVGFDVLHNLNVPAIDLPFSDKRKLQIAIALCSDPTILLLDDPFSFLNYEQATDLIQILRKLLQKGDQNGQTKVVVFTTCQEQIAKMSDRKILVKDGCLIEYDQEQQVLLKFIEEEKDVNSDAGNSTSQKLVANQSSTDNQIASASELKEGEDQEEKVVDQAVPEELIVHEQQIISNTKLFSKQFKAVFKRRWLQAVNNKKGSILRHFGPICVIVLGYFACRSYITTRTPSRILSPDWYDDMQQITVNEKPIDLLKSDTEVSSVMKNLPMFETKFDVQYANRTVYNDYYKFWDQILQMCLKSEYYNYGSYSLYQVNQKDHQYKFATFVNLTDIYSNILFPQFMYEALLKTATNDPTFEFKTRSTPYPLRPYQKAVIHRQEKYHSTMNSFTFKSVVVNQAKLAEGPIYIFCASFAVSASFILYKITQERISHQKLVQTMNGLQLNAYWIANYCFDVMTLQAMVAVTIFLMMSFDELWKVSLLVFASWPFAIVAVIYAFSFFAKDAAQSQIIFIVSQLFIMLCVSQLAFNLRMVETIEFIADLALWVLRLLPSFPLVNSMYIEATNTRLLQLRIYTKEHTKGSAKFGNPSPWAVINCTGDIAMQMLQMVGYLLLLVIIEFNGIKRIKAALRARFATHELVKEEVLSTQVNEGFNVQSLNYSVKALDSEELTKIFSDVSFKIGRGQLMVLQSEQNSCKVALIKAITNELVANSGSVFIEGVDMSQVCGQYPNLLIGYAPFEINLFETLTVEQHLQYYAGVKGIEIEPEVGFLMQSLKLKKHQQTLVGQINTGHRRLLQIAIALVGKPKVLIIDGAFEGLDTESIKLVCQLVKNALNTWKPAILVGVSSIPDDLKSIATIETILDYEAGELVFVQKLEGQEY